jgi:hypothetical protein
MTYVQHGLQHVQRDAFASDEDRFVERQFTLGSHCPQRSIAFASRPERS